MGQNMVGWCSVSVLNTNGAGLSGYSVTLRHAEALQPDTGNYGAFGPAKANIYVANLTGAAQTETYILSSDTNQLFQPHFTYHAFRYVEIVAPQAVAAALSLSSLAGCVIRSSVPATGQIWCSDTNSCSYVTNLLSKLMTNASRVIGGNLEGIFSSCGGRNEREGYLYDEHITSQTACYDFDVAAFFTKTIRDIRLSQDSRQGGPYSGSYPILAPYVNYLEPPYSDPGCQSGGLVFPWRLYQNYADTRMVAEHYASAQGWFGYLAHNCTNTDGSWKTTIWNTIQPQVDDWQEGDHFGGFGGTPAPSDWYIKPNNQNPSASTGYF